MTAKLLVGIERFDLLPRAEMVVDAVDFAGPRRSAVIEHKRL